MSPRELSREHGPDACSELDQQGTAQQVGAKDQVPERRILGDKVAETLRRYNQNLARLAYHRSHEHCMPGQQVQLAQEPARAVHADNVLLRSVARDDRHLPREDHEEVATGIPFAKQHLARLRAAPTPMRRKSLDLRLAQPGERPVKVGRLSEPHGLRRSHMSLTAPRPGGADRSERPGATAGSDAAAGQSGAATSPLALRFRKRPRRLPGIIAIAVPPACRQDLHRAGRIR